MLASRRDELVRAATELLEEQGPDAMTARKITARVGLSSMAIYTEFGSMGGLANSVVEHGFSLLAAELESLELAGDPLANLWTGLSATRSFALEHRDLYTVMFAADRIGGVRREGQDLVRGVETLQFLHRGCAQAHEAELLQARRTRDITLHLWAVLHGNLMLELAGYMDWEDSPDDVFRDAVYRALLAFGADTERARTAVGQPG